MNDKTAEEFTTYMRKFTDLYIAMSNLVKNQTTAPQPYILDLGCGPGLLSVEILKKIPNSTVIGIDPLVKMLSIAKENASACDAHTFIPVLGISEKIPLKDQSINTIVTRFSLPYWKQPHVSFLEMHRVLKPKGRIVFETLNRSFPKWKLYGVKIGMLLHHAGRDVTKYHVDAYSFAYTQEEVETFFMTSGFDILEKKGKKNQWKFIITAKKR